MVNTLQVRTRPRLYMLSALPVLLRLFFLLHVLQRWFSFFPLDSYPTTILDFRLHIYDMTAPLSKPTQVLRPTERPSRRSEYDEPTTLNIIKVIQGLSGGWTITDSHLSPDNERFLHRLFPKNIWWLMCDQDYLLHDCEPFTLLR